MNTVSRNQKMNQIKSDIIFSKIKSDFFLRKLFDFMKRNNSLKIMKYNKKLQKRLNLSIKDFKEGSELYSSIEIEIKPTKNKNNHRFINRYDDELEYYHIYFDDKKEEIKTNDLTRKDKVNKIKIVIDYQVESFKELFADCYRIESIHFKKFHRININDMGLMFYRCSTLKEINFSNFNTKNVTNMKSMFYECSSLKELNLSNFNTNKVINMCGMFEECLSLKKVNVSNFKLIM